MGHENPTREIGTERWLEQTGGRLTIAQALVMSTQGLAQAAGDKFGPRRPTPVEASAQAQRVSVAREQLGIALDRHRQRILTRQGQALLNHACRTYLLGAALVPNDIFERVNHTSATVAALTHDDGLVHPSTPGHCFTIDSAHETTAVMTPFGESPETIGLSRAAVIAHFQPKLPSQASAETRLVALGASADAMGFGLKKIDPQLLTQVWLEWPDLGFIGELKDLLIRERRRAPRTRPGVLALSGMPTLLRRAR